MKNFISTLLIWISCSILIFFISIKISEHFIIKENLKERNRFFNSASIGKLVYQQVIREFKIKNVNLDSIYEIEIQKTANKIYK